jgi:integrase
LKSGNSTEQELTEREIKAIKSYLRVRGFEPGPLFLARSVRHPHPVGRRMLDVLMKKYGEKAGLPVEKGHFHCLRHSCATSLLNLPEEERLGIEDIQDHLGHVDIRNTMEYAKIQSSRRNRTGERLREAW